MGRVRIGIAFWLLAGLPAAAHPAALGAAPCTGTRGFAGVPTCRWLAAGQDRGLPTRPSGPPTIVFMTDFGIDNDAVPICKGVMWNIDPDVRIVDLTHAVKPYSIRDGARFLYGAAPYYPSGTVFVVVIDPTLGSSRKAVVVKSKRGQYFVLPDNGLMTLVEDRDGVEGAREITNPAWMIGKAVSSTFHGRDIFSPVGAHLARAEDWTQVGPEVQKLVRLNIKAARLDEKGISGDIIALDTPFGNLISNIGGEEFLKLSYARGDQVRVKLGDREMVLPFVKTFSDVAIGKPLLYIDSRGRLGLAVNQGNFSQVYRMKPPLEVFISQKRGRSCRSDPCGRAGQAQGCP